MQEEPTVALHGWLIHVRGGIKERTGCTVHYVVRRYGVFGIWGKRGAGDCTHRPRRKAHLMAPALAGMALAATVMTQTAVANPLDNLASLLGFGDAAPAAAADHVVSDTVSPSGTTIDLFDYWLTTESGPENPGNITSAGINADNQLWFSDGIPEGGNGDYGKTINHYGGGGKGPHFGIVAPELGHDGYPVLAEGNKYSLADGGRQTEPRSLAYLFNPLVPNTYKKSYPSVPGLLQLDADGYYYYDSTQNFASYNKDANRFVLYDGAAVDGSGFADSTKGMFFPFNTAEQVFTEESLNGSGPLQSTVGPGGLNHYFGLSMTSYFMQPANGQSNGKDMVFEFSGDDDVWVFIDGKLVGDVGGIHERVGLSINFATGAIRIYNTSTAGGDGNKDKTYKETSLQEVFGGENLESGTFKAGSYHTLKFYYLERGSGPSNLSLKYNLVDIPASTVTKVDQLGKGVQGAEFELYQTDAAYGNEKLIGSGVTDATGCFTFTDANTVPINFMTLSASGISHYVLKETKTPEGYRKSPDARLKYVTNADKSIGFLLSDNSWESGVYARPEQVVTIVGDTVKEYGSDNKIEVGDGNVFAVILKRDRSVDDMNACWHAVSGNSVDGWTVSEAAITSTSQLADAQKVVFTKNEDGKYVADLKELPGDPEQYYSMVSKENQDAGNFDYTVAFYAYDGKDNIKRLDTSTQYFQRQSAANLHVTDIRNMLHVQKVDDAGTPVNGVSFNLYRSSQMIETGGKLAPRAGEDPAFTGKTQDNRNNNDATIKMDGMLSLGPLSPGTYYLVEDADKAPKGYIPNDAVVRVIVDDEGVHADAGVEGDGVVTLGGIGSLVDSMSQFGVKDDIDMTLYRVIATKATSTASDADGDGAYALDAWKPGTDTVTMENHPDSAYLEYVPVDSGVTEPGFSVDTGYVRATVSQAEKPSAVDLGMANWTDLSKVDNKNLSALFTGTNIVRITNERMASIVVSKEVAVPEGFELSKDAKERDFTLNFTFGNLGNLPADTAFDAATFAVDKDGVERQVGNDYTITSGGTHTLKHGEAIKVYGLPDKATYEVRETPDVLYPQTQPANDTGATPAIGAIESGKTAIAKFVNTYTPAPVTVDGEAFSYKKHFNLMRAEKQDDGTYKEVMEKEDGAWEKFSPADATFTMLLAEVKEGVDATECPFPDGAPTSEKDGSTFMTKSVTRTSDAGGASGSFGSITFDRPGTYTYLITEDLSGTLVDGITYSRASYRVVVTVTDNEKGKLKASIVKKQTFGEAGVELDAPLSLDAAKPVTFNNSAAYDSITLGPNAYKQLLDTAGDRALAAGEFVFGAVPITEGAPIPTDQNGNPLPTDTDVNGAQYYKSTNDTLGYIAFGTATFTQEHVKTGDSAAYVYKLFEVIPNDAVNANVAGGKKSYAEADEAQRVQAGWTKDGVTYDSSVYYARVTVKIDGNSTDNVNHVTAKISYHKSPEPNAAVIIGNGVTFKNVYDPADAVLTGDARIKGQKTLKGRDALADEAFTFELTAFDDFTKQALESDALVFGSDRTATKLTARVEGAENGKPRDFVFDSAMTFSKVGTYRFAIKESVPKPAAPNMTYDPATAEAVVTIADVGGKLKAEVSYINPQAPSIIDRAVFTNVYHAEGALAEGIEVSKVLTGRAMKKTGEFSATVVGIDNTAGNTTDDEANAKLSKADTKILFPKASAGTTVGKKILGDILFTQEDAGKTFSYIVAEDVPAEGIDTEGVSYDRSQYRVDLAVTDTGTGKLSVTPTVTKIVDRDGKSLAHPETAQVAAFENRYEPAQTVIGDTTGVLPLTKKLSGRGWLDTDKFEFALTAKSLNGKTDADSLTKIPMPEDARAVVTKDGAPHYDSTTGAVPDATIKDFGFKGITYKQAGTYVYEVREVIPDDATNPDVPGKTYGQVGADERAKAGWTRGGVTYDSAMVATVTCEVKDNLTGQLYVEASCDPAAVPTFTNTNAAATPADASVEIQATKTFVNHQLGAGEFEFGVAPFKNDGKLGDEVLSGTNGAAGSDQPAQVNFTGKLSYNTVDLAKAVKAGYANESIDGSGRATWTLKYLAYEKALDTNRHPGVTQTASSFNFTVTVTDNGDGTLSAVANYPAGGLAFVNTYNTQGDNAVTYAPTGAKVLQTASEGLAAPDINGCYQFTLTGEDGAPMPAAGGSVTVNDQGSVNFDAITFTLDMLDGIEQANDGSRSRTFTYAVKEEGFVPGVTNDADSKSFKLTLKDDGKGSLTVTPEGDPRLPLFTFVNTYTAQVPESDPVTTDGLFAKVLAGRDWMRGDAFTFVIEPVVDGTPMPDVTKVVLRRKSAKADEPQAFGFSKIRFTYDDMKGSIPSADGTGTEKTFGYTVREVVPEDAAKIPGITYSDNVAHLEITLRDDGKGNLTATRTLTDDEGTVVFDDKGDLKTPATFTNVYTPGAVEMDPAAAGFSFTKVLKGKAWDGDEFAFTLEGAEGAPMPEADEGAGVVANGDGTVTKTVSAATHKVDGFDAADFGFGPIRFERAGEYAYTAREVVPAGAAANPGITYDDHTAKVTVTVTDDGAGRLAATAAVEGATFTNRYATGTVDFDAAAGLQIVKTLTGRPIAAGDFEFTMAPADDATKAKFGDAKVIATNAAELGIGELTNTAIATTSVKTGLEFTLADVGKTYTFELSETKGGGTGYVNDQTKHTLTFATADNGNGTLSVTVTLDGEKAAVWTSGSEITPVSVGFTNSYSAGSITVGGQGGVALAGTKQLTGRPMVAGEFHFNVTNAKDQTESAAVVATGTNAANGTITFTGIEYTTEKLNNDVAAGLATVDRTGDSGDVYTYTYNVSEDAAKNDKGISIIQGEQAITVKVTDNRAGKLSAEVVYPQDGMVFKNAYGTGANGTKVIALNGTKVLDVKSGNKVPDIAGKYTFTLTGSEGAPMPATTTATNDASGSISFGEITYTMENVFGAPAAQPEQPAVAEDEADTADAKTAGATDAKADEADAKADDAVAAEAEAKPAEGESSAKAAAADEPMVASAPRSKTFTYTVTETGSVAGVANDPVATKTIKVTVTDKGDGTLTVDKQAESDKTDFTFTNTYSVKPSDSTLTGEGGFTITKTLDGRDLREGEFEFALASQAEGEQTVVTAKNDASGKVAFPAISFNAPGEYRYRLAEVDGGLGGVTYDTTVYDVTATVVDNGDGTLGVTWSVSKDGQPLEGKEIVFANSYKAAGTSITFNAAKVLTGRDLKKGEFAFELRDANGKVLQTVKNGAPTEGGCAPIAFDPITYDEPGTYDYRIVEVKGDAEGVTYDETEFTYHVVVTDDGNGQLKVEWAEGKAGAPVFQNVYVKPEDPSPADPAKPADPGNGGSGDKLVQTGDSSLPGIAAAAVAGALVLGVGIAKRRKSE